MKNGKNRKVVKVKVGKLEKHLMCLSDRGQCLNLPVHLTVLALKVSHPETSVPSRLVGHVIIRISTCLIYYLVP